MKTIWVVSVLVGAMSAAMAGGVGYYLYLYWTLFYFVGVTALVLSWFPLLRAVKRTNRMPVKALMIGGILGSLCPFLYSVLR